MKRDDGSLQALCERKLLYARPSCTWWSFSARLGCSAAHCPAAGNPDGTAQGSETLFSQEPLGGKHSNQVLENTRRKKISLPQTSSTAVLVLLASLPPPASTDTRRENTVQAVKARDHSWCLCSPLWTVWTEVCWRGHIKHFAKKM